MGNVGSTRRRYKLSNSGASANKSENPQAVNPALPAWIWGLGAILLIALIYTSYQMVQAQQGLEQAHNELAGMREAATGAQDTQTKLVKEVSSLKKNLMAARKSLRKLKGELKDANSKAKGKLKAANTKVKRALAESKKQKMAGEKQQKMALRFKQEGEKQAASLREKLSAEKTRLGRLKGELKDAGSRLELVLAESKKQQMAGENQQKLALRYKQDSERQVVSLREKLAAEKTRLGRLEGELKTANAKLELALAESKKQKLAAEIQQKLAQKYKEEARRAAAPPAQ